MISFHLLCPHKLYIKILFHGSYTFDLENYLLWDLIMHIPHIKNLKLFFFFGSDLFEVVDRRAKLVVSELSDEQSDSQSAGIDLN